MPLKGGFYPNLAAVGKEDFALVFGQVRLCSQEPGIGRFLGDHEQSQGLCGILAPQGTRAEGR
jgi:hypothetical protein